jgi:hypothetical protein
LKAAHIRAGVERVGWLGEPKTTYCIDTYLDPAIHIRSRERLQVDHEHPFMTGTVIAMERSLRNDHRARDARAEKGRHLMSVQPHNAHSSPQFLASGNPSIQYSGTAAFGKNQYCVWTTKDGSISQLTIQNPNKDNTLTFVISGAPSTMTTTTGAPLNSQFSIPPNSPTTNVTAVGNFLGTLVTIFNMSTLQATCQVNAVVAAG